MADTGVRALREIFFGTCNAQIRPLVSNSALTSRNARTTSIECSFRLKLAPQRGVLSRSANSFRRDWRQNSRLQYSSVSGGPSTTEGEWRPVCRPAGAEPHGVSVVKEATVNLNQNPDVEKDYLTTLSRQLGTWRHLAKNCWQIPLLLWGLGAFIVATFCCPSYAAAAGAVAETAGGAASSAPAARSWGTNILISAWTGLVAGGLHTLTGPDHLAALAPLAIGRSRIESAAIGALWGCGHDAGQVLFGILFVLVKDKLQLELFKMWGTRVVALMLIAIGAIGIQEARSASQEESSPIVIGEDGMAAKPQANGTLAAKPPLAKRAFGAATFITGIAHGLHPDALVILLPLLALPSRAAGAAFLLMFLLGTVVAMGSYTAFIGSCSEALQERVPGFTRRLSWVAAFLAIGLGLLILLCEILGYSLF